jgi:hypothetical protein
MDGFNSEERFFSMALIIQFVFICLFVCSSVRLLASCLGSEVVCLFVWLVGWFLVGWLVAGWLAG